MKLSLDRSLRMIWLVIGAVLLLFLLGGGLMVVSQLVRNAGAGDDAVRVASEQPRPAAEQQARAVRYGPPVPIRGTDARMVPVEHGRGYEDRDYASTASRYGGNQVNAIFLDADGSARVLLESPAYIRNVRYPRPSDTRVVDESAWDADWITWEVAMDDTNRNQRLDSGDEVALFVTDLAGRNLRPVLRPPLRYRGHSVHGPGQMLVYALEPPPGGEKVDEDRMRQRAFLFDLASGRLSPHAALDSAAASAARILAR